MIHVDLRRRAPRVDSDHPLVQHVLHHRKLGIAGVPDRNPPRLAHPTGIELRFAADISNMLGLHEVLAPLVSSLPRLVDEAKAEMRTDARDVMGRAMEQIEVARRQAAGNVSTSRVQMTANKIAQQTSAFQNTQISGQVKSALGVNIQLRDRQVPTIVQRFAHENVQLIQGLSQRTLDKVGRIVARGFSTGRPASDIQSDITQRIGIADRHASLIARDQVGTLRSQLARVRSAELGLREYTWITMGDEAVRDSHEVRDGRTYRYGVGIAPGEEICCRCLDEPVLVDVLRALEFGDDD